MASQTKPSLVGIADLLSEAWWIYVKRFWTYFGIVLAPVLAMVGLFFLFPVGIRFVMPVSFEFVQALAFVCAFLIELVIFPVAEFTLITLINRNQERLGVIEASRHGLKKIWLFCWTQALMKIVLLAGLSLFILPGVIIMVWLSFVLFIVIFENLSGFDAFSRSRKYTEGYWWNIFVRILPIMLLNYVLVRLVGYFNLFSEPGFGGIFSFLVCLFVQPLVIICQYLIYIDIRRIKEPDSLQINFT